MGLCAIAVLDGLLGETTIKQHVAVFDAVRAKVGGGSAYRFAYVDGVCNRCDERFASLCLAAFRNMVTFSQ
jgi:predicted metal-binding protein